MRFLMRAPAEETPGLGAAIFVGRATRRRLVVPGDFAGYVLEPRSAHQAVLDA
jgi:hypothetical protein